MLISPPYQLPDSRTTPIYPPEFAHKLWWVDVAKKGIPEFPTGLQAHVRSLLKSHGAAGFQGIRTHGIFRNATYS